MRVRMHDASEQSARGFIVTNATCLPHWSDAYTDILYTTRVVVEAPGAARTACAWPVRENAHTRRG